MTRLRDYYGRPVALELGPIYTAATGFESEMHFLGWVAEAADTFVILDLAHWQIANRNLDRPGDYGLDAIDPARIIELHVAGMRPSADGRFCARARALPMMLQISSYADGSSRDATAAARSTNGSLRPLRK